MLRRLFQITSRDVTNDEQIFHVTNSNPPTVNELKYFANAFFCLAAKTLTCIFEMQTQKPSRTIQGAAGDNFAP